MTGDEDEHSQYAALASEMAQPAEDLPAGPPGQEGYAEYAPRQYAREPEPQPQQRRAEPQQRRQEQPQPQYGNDLLEDPIGALAVVRDHVQGKAFHDAIEKSETTFRGELNDGDYDAACEHAVNHRRAEIARQLPDTQQTMQAARQRGFQNPAQLRQAILEMDVHNLMLNAASQGMDPARAAFQEGLARGYRSPTPILKSYLKNITENYHALDDKTEQALWAQLRQAHEEAEAAAREQD